jgi:hypothetical protein
MKDGSQVVTQLQKRKIGKVLPEVVFEKKLFLGHLITEGGRKGDFLCRLRGVNVVKRR